MICRFLIDDDDDVDKYLIFLLQFITCILFCKFDLIDFNNGIQNS